MTTSTMLGTTVSPPSGAMTVSHTTLTDRVGHFLFGTRSPSGDQLLDINDCIKDGLRDVYAAHDWSFFKPVVDLTTTAPYTTGTVEVIAGVVTGTGTTFPSAWSADGILKVGDGYYSVASYDSATQLTLDDTTVAAAALSTFSLGRPEIPLDDAFEAVAGKGELTYYPSVNDIYPPVQPKNDTWLRTYQQRDPYYERPLAYSIRTVEFDPLVGSRKRLALYPTPDQAYTLRVEMILRPTMIDATNLYPVGGETLAQVITEACLAAAERNFDERGNQHTKRFMELLPLAIGADSQKSTPASLGLDGSRLNRYSHLDGCTLDTRAWRLGTITLGGSDL